VKYKLQICLLLSLLLTAITALTSIATLAAIEELSFTNEQQHDRYQKLISELRCPKCLNANLAGSDAPIAADLRAEIYEQILAGNSDAEILDFLTDRYGDFILYRPPLNPGTTLLWFGPPLLLLAGFFIARRMLVNSAALAANDVLSGEEQQQLARLVATKKDGA